MAKQEETSRKITRIDRPHSEEFKIPEIPGAVPQILRGLGEKKWPSHPGMIAEEKIVPQLGTPPGYQRDTDSYMEEILSNLNPTEVAWTSIADIIPAEAGGDFWKRLSQVYTRRKRSQGGWTSKNIVSVTGNLRGVQGRPDIARKPNVFSRNITNRDWKERAVEEGKEVVQD